MTITRLDPGPRLAKAVTHGETIYLMGHVANEGDADIKTQTRQVLANIEKTLGAVGSDKSKLLTVTIYLASIGDFAAMNEVWDGWVDKANAPARTTVEARLARANLKVEMTAIAAK